MGHYTNWRENRGKTERKKPRTPFIKHIIEDIGKATYKDLKVAALDTEEWRTIKVI